ncbi:MAG: hypothetical protein JXR96_25330 [Deltaproteobacteria bacterium]|nr:hypothetical protein [Deltaproteobacteria bacterium]
MRVLGGSVKTARRDFGLSTEDAVREFIGNNGLELPSYIKTDPWANNPNPTQDVWVDVYSFYSGSLFGYLAFFRAPTGKWIIKSFKKNDRPDPRFLQIKAALERLKGGGQ